jgi:hypothetical protein
VERELAERVRAHDALTLRPLSPEERERTVQAWTAVQQGFIEDPRGAARQADRVVVGMLTAAGYPSEDRERQLELASVDHAYAVSDYRRGRELLERSAAADGRDGPAAESTETLRQAVLHYSVLVKSMLKGNSRIAAGRAPAGRRQTRASIPGWPTPARGSGIGGADRAREDGCCDHG